MDIQTAEVDSSKFFITFQSRLTVNNNKVKLYKFAQSANFDCHYKSMCLPVYCTLYSLVKMKMLLTVITVLVLCTNRLVVADDQCTHYRFKSPFYPGSSCEDIYNKNPESREISGYYWITDGLRNVYCGMNYTGLSCEDIYNNNPETGNKNGYYFINNNMWTFCNMTTIAAIADGIILSCAWCGGTMEKNCWYKH